VSRRTRSPHPGVVLEPPHGEHTTWRARFVDPDTGRKTRVRLDPLVLGSKEARRAWAVQKAKTLAKRRVELESGAPRATGTGLSEAIAKYFEAHPALRPNTVTAYRAAAKKFEVWAAKAGVTSADAVNRARLMAFREKLAKTPKRTAVKGGKRGARADASEPRSAHALNRDLRSVRTILGYLIDRDLLPRCTHDDLRRALKRDAAPVERISFLKQAELRKLLDAAIAHDAEKFEETREEHAGKRERGTTARYEAIAPFTVTALMTGMRAGACLELKWENVDLDALDTDGRVMGEIHPRGGSRTKRTGAIGLEVSPALRELLKAMQPADARGRVFTDLSAGVLKAAAKRLVRDCSAPASFTWQALRKTCGTFLTNAPGIFGAASAYRSAKQLGHSVTVAEKHYVGLVRGIPLTAKTLEAAMGVEAQVNAVIRAAAVRANPVKASQENA
jgi:integrase